MVFFYLARYGQLSGLVEPFAGVLGAALGKNNFFVFLFHVPKVFEFLAF
jgi:hypothetical protein